MQRKNIDAKEARNDIISGMDHAELMRKYNLSIRGLVSLFDKMIASGAISVQELEGRIPTPDTPLSIRNQFTDQVVFSAPAETVKDLVEQAAKQGVDLSEAELTGANLSGLVAPGANFTEAMLYRANLNGADLSGALFPGAELSQAKLCRAVLIRANLSGANLSEADATNADFHEACLMQTNLDNACLQDADLRDADLTESRLVGANVMGANLQGAKMEGVMMEDTSH